jgi:hypothetical protein
VTELLEKKEASLADLRELLCPATTEKTEKVPKQAGIDSGPEKPSVAGVEGRGAKRKASRRSGVPWRAAGPSSARVIKARR